MIRIREETPKNGGSPKVYLNVENKFEVIEDSYPVVIRPKSLTHSVYLASVLEKKN
ncbi:conserved protein of unknown function [Candidatus Nitrosocosmicus franklandus]|uniref:Uncharacterized protein n=1 Tax=Candidatus Nitrosocosmicus franklandianus TaxID=1798806 RepID=A0A484IBP1_9ARCH|nr:conserved protein of unknown function [Candidatus Nitrosocosmicus franklandus]